MPTVDGTWNTQLPLLVSGCDSRIVNETALFTVIILKEAGVLKFSLSACGSELYAREFLQHDGSVSMRMLNHRVHDCDNGQLDLVG